MKQGTIQGIYVFTPGGTFLGFAYGDVDPKGLHGILLDALAAWDKLPESERHPGAASIPPPGPPDPQFTRTPPERGLILAVHSRTLGRAASGDLALTTGKTALFEGQVPAFSQPDRLWLTEAEWRSILPAAPRLGQRSSLPAAVIQRIARFHLVDDTRGEMPPWKPEEVRFARMEAIVETATPDDLLLRIEGAAVMGNPVYPGSPRDFVARLIGSVHLDRKRDRIDRFEMVAIGEHRGNGPFTAAPPPGAHTLGIAFQLLAPGAPFAQIPPHGARDEADYFGAPAPASRDCQSRP